VDLVSASSPAISTVVVRGPTVPAARVAAKVVLNAFRTRDWGSAAAISAAAELSDRDHEGVEGLEVQRVRNVDDDLPGELLTALGDALLQRLDPDRRLTGLYDPDRQPVATSTAPHDARGVMSGGCRPSPRREELRGSDR
jgi:hypothetical protein